MQLKKDVYILFLSDIHFRVEYSQSFPFVEDRDNKKSGFDYLWDNFIFEIESKWKDRITHVLINGDLVFNAKNFDFNEISKKFKMLFSKLKNVPIIFTPGNHDVEWERLLSTFINNTEGLIIDKEQILIAIKKYLEFDYKDKSRLNVVSNYKAFLNLFSEFNVVGIDKSGLDSWNCATYFFDSNFNVCFNILNSSLNSHGDGIKDILRYLKRIYGSRLGEPGLSELLIDLVTIFKEQGNQVYTQDVNYIDQIHRIKEERPLVISCAHHPIEWLQYDQIYESNEDFPLKQIKNYSHVHFTSHEHIDPSDYFNYSKEGVLFLKSGKFSDSELTCNGSQNVADLNSKIFNSNWFSIIKIVATSGSNHLSHMNFKFKFNSFNNSSWEPINETKQHVLYERGTNFIDLLNNVIQTTNQKDLLECLKKVESDYLNIKRDLLNQIDSTLLMD
ncbi:MAG: metallophosphoesterase [Saprospiraceae bacterium]|nr:metallophosphoesterase [Candidatus Vicinibacter affinis]MBK6571596.1 metallophosphoesterase [Candidatus Vicinibacter affinis]MBK7797971.1 metallophosphoesterase [Candidatus Vicinibacter affinis]MBK9642482.1 metallophosphoesterase [Candidatus Vicinibacter affinis]